MACNELCAASGASTGEDTGLTPVAGEARVSCDWERSDSTRNARILWARTANTLKTRGEHAENKKRTRCENM